MKSQLSDQNQAEYYNHWYVATIHVMLSIAEFRTRKAIAEHLKLGVGVVTEVLDFLVSVGLAERKGEQFHIGGNRIHLRSDSSLISKHHINWRLQAMNALYRIKPGDLHFSGV